MRTWTELTDLGLNTGKKTRLRRILFEHGLRNGTALFLPYDQGLEHGPRDFFANPVASDPAYITRLAVEGGFNGIAIQIGLAEKFYWDYAGEVPLIVWAYPRGSAIVAKGGKDSFYAVDYAARTASELGADVTKVNFPRPDKHTGVPGGYETDFTAQQAISAVTRSANRTMLLVSGGERAGDDAMLEKARMSMEAGAIGLIFGRNVWQREHAESLRFVSQLREILAKYPWEPGRAAR